MLKNAFYLRFDSSITTGAIQTCDSIPIGPRPPQTCQRLTTNRPIESAPDKPCSLPPTFFRRSTSDWDLA